METLVYLFEFDLRVYSFMLLYYVYIYLQVKW